MYSSDEPKKDILPALPIKSGSLKKDKSVKRITSQHILCFICAAFSFFILSTSAIDETKNISKEWILNHISKELFYGGKKANILGLQISETAFGNANTDIQTQETAKEALQSEPTQKEPLSSYYVEKEEIAEQILESKADEILQKEEIYSYSSEIPNGCYPIIPADVSAKKPNDIKNETSIEINLTEIEKQAMLFAPCQVSKEPLVLIVHTHGTESFAKEGVLYYNDEINYPRSENVSENVVAVGKTIAEELNNMGIVTVHCETMHDKDSYINAYERSAESIRYYLEKYPSIKYVFDIHRDSLIRSDMTKLKPVTIYQKAPCAQIMLIIGSNEKGAPEYSWQNNLILALAIQQNIFKKADDIARRPLLRGATYNQQHASYGLLVEIGSCGNTLGEAKNAAKVFARSLAEVINPNT